MSGPETTAPTQAVEVGLDEYTELRYLKPEECIFAKTIGGFLSMILGDTSYPRVSVSRAFPLSYPMRYLSVRDKESKEIGIISEMNAFPQEIQEMLLEELERRYFTPRISLVYSLKDEFGYTYWDVETDRGRRKFTAKGSESVISLSEGHVIVIDVDGNRFEIEDYRRLDAKSFRLIDVLI